MQTVLVALRATLHHLKHDHQSQHRHHAHATHRHANTTIHPLRQHRRPGDLQLLLFLHLLVPMLPIVVLLGESRQPERQRLLHESSSCRCNILRLFRDFVYNRLGFLDSPGLPSVEPADGSPRKGFRGSYSCHRRIVSSANQRSNHQDRVNHDSQ